MDKSDKVRLNTEIVSMRSDVKKAKDLIIKMLERNIRNMEKKVTENQVRSYQRKIHELVNELYEIKKLSSDEISKFVLSNKKTPGEILTNIVSMRKDVKIAKGVIIRELLRNIKILKKMVAENQVGSYQRKIDELVNELNEIKKVSFDEISKHVHSNTPGENQKNIVSMREDVKKAKGFIIQELVTKISILERMVAENQGGSYQRKIDELVNELNEIKKESFDEISKLVLSNKKAPGEILTNTQSSLRERIVARFCANKFVRVRSDKIKAEFPNLDDLLCSSRERGSKKQKKPRKNNNAESNKKGQDDLCPSSGGRLLMIQNEDTDDSGNNGDTVIHENISENSESDANSETDDRKIQTKHMTHNTFVKNIPSSEHKPLKRKINTGVAQNKKPRPEIDSFFFTDKWEDEICIVKDAGSPELLSNENNNLKASWKGETNKETNFLDEDFKEKQLQSEGDRNN